MSQVFGPTCRAWHGLTDRIEFLFGGDIRPRLLQLRHFGSSDSDHPQAISLVISGLFESPVKGVRFQHLCAFFYRITTCFPNHGRPMSSSLSPSPRGLHNTPRPTFRFWADPFYHRFSPRLLIGCHPYSRFVSFHLAHVSKLRPCKMVPYSRFSRALTVISIL